MSDHYTAPDIQIERGYLRCQTLRDILCLQALAHEMPRNQTLQHELEFKLELYLRLTREANQP